jgi:hypothetical protein
MDQPYIIPIAKNQQLLNERLMICRREFSLLRPQIASLIVHKRIQIEDMNLNSEMNRSYEDFSLAMQRDATFKICGP